MMEKAIEIHPKRCLLSWDKLREMKDNKIEFWAGDGFNLVRIIDMDEKLKNIYMINQTGKITWPLRYPKLEEAHNKVHNKEITLLPHEVDKLVPTWGNYITGLLKYLGCDIV